MSEILTQTTRPELPRFNGWRYLTFVTSALLIFSLPFVGLFFSELLNSPVPVSATWFASGATDKDLRKALLQVQDLQRDTARMGKQLRAIVRTVPNVIEVGAEREIRKANIQPIPPFPRLKSEYPSFCAWATDAMRYYRRALADAYTAMGVAHNIPTQ